MGGKQREGYAPTLPKVKDGALPKRPSRRPRSGRDSGSLQELGGKREVCPAVLGDPVSHPLITQISVSFFPSL